MAWLVLPNLVGVIVLDDGERGSEDTGLHDLDLDCLCLWNVCCAEDSGLFFVDLLKRSVELATDGGPLLRGEVVVLEDDGEWGGVEEGGVLAE